MKKKKFGRWGLRSVFILMLAYFLILSGRSLLAEKAYEGVKIPEFPAPPKPKDYEPDWKNYPWFPKGHPEKFDPSQPDAAEKLEWLSKDTYDCGYNFDGDAHVMDENRFGHIRNMRGARSIIFLYGRDFLDVMTYKEGKVKEGDEEFKSIIFWGHPSQIKGLANLTWKYLETPAVKREQDRWLYVPSLRRTRRLAAGADEDKLNGTDLTMDDLGEREVWEEEYALIGEDIIKPDEHTYYMYTPKDKDLVEMWEKFPRVMSKAGFDCWVYLGINRKPKYYFPKRIIWIDKRTFLRVREEQYDKQGNLWKIYEFGYSDLSARYYKGDDPEVPKNRYYKRDLYNIWDLKINHRSFIAIARMFFDKDSHVGWAGEGSPPQTFFDVKRLEREEYGRLLPPPPSTKRLNEIIPIPRLRREVFKQYRPIVLPEELEKKLLEEYGE